MLVLTQSVTFKLTFYVYKQSYLNVLLLQVKINYFWFGHLFVGTEYTEYKKKSPFCYNKPTILLIYSNFRANLKILVPRMVTYYTRCYALYL